METGRNDPCPCGSGKKYKKCCIKKSTDTSRTGDLGITEQFLRDKLQKFMMRDEFGDDIRNAWMLFWNEKDTSSMRDIDKDKYREFTEWYIHEYRLAEHNIPLIELYYQRYKNKLPPNALSVLKDWLKSYYGIFEVQKVVPGNGAHVKDVISGNEFYLNDVSSSKDLLIYDIIFSHITPMYGKYYTSGAGYRLPNQVKDELIKYIDRRLQEYILANNDTLTISQFVNKHPRIFNEFMQAYNAKEYMPLTCEGHAICISKSTFRIKSYFPVEQFFDKNDKFSFMGHGDGKKDGLRYDYLIPYDPNSMKQNTGDDCHRYMTLCYNDKGEQRLCLANFTLTLDRLYIECMSKERLETVKELLAPIIELGAIVHIGTTHEDMSHFTKRMSDEPDTVEEKKEKNPEHVKHLSDKFLKTYTLNWLDTNQNELDGMTPREAAKTEDGKSALKEILKVIENQYERNKKIDEPYMDIHLIKKELGMD